MLYCTSTVAFGATSLKGGFFFPILGGRLLKGRNKKSSPAKQVVSNPWREAIEVFTVKNLTVL